MLENNFTMHFLNAIYRKIQLLYNAYIFTHAHFIHRYS